MDNQENFGAMTLEELEQEKAKVNSETHPEDALLIDQLIAAKVNEQKLHESLLEPKTAPVKFHGTATAYFPIWIVNILLTIVTLGIYSAWAKVRTNRYFYSSTEIDGHRFSYLATPLQILKGRIIAVLIFGGFYLAITFSPAVAGVLMLAYVVLMPWILCKSIKFNMQMTGYRNIRFNFHGKYGQAFLVFMLYPFLSIFTLYLAMPLALKAIDTFLYENISYGDKNIETDLSGGTYYKAAFGAAFIALLMFTVVMMGIGFEAFGNMADPEAKPSVVTSIIFMATYVGVFIVSGSFYTKIIRNHVFANSKIEDVANFNSSIGVTSLAVLRLTNILALICSLGLAIPWIKVRTANYFAMSTEVTVLPGANDVIADQSQGVNAIGDEVAEAFDFDIAIT